MENLKIQEHQNHCEEVKKNLPDGPWMNEIHRLEFKHEGLDCLINRNPSLFVWCGYVGVPKGHALYGTHYDDVNVDVHGGLTFSRECHGYVCHQANNEVWWLGFDCAHMGDLMPEMMSAWRMLLLNGLSFDAEVSRGYKNIDYVREETKRLAEQIAKIA